MHEVSLVRNIFRTLDEEFSREELSRLSGIDLKVGMLSNVEPVLMQNAFEAVTSDEKRFQKVELKIKLLPIVIECEKCGLKAEVQNYLFKCPNGHPSNNIIQGQELLIESVHFKDP